MEWGVGESSCADSWGRALKTGEPSYPSRILQNDGTVALWRTNILMAIPPAYLPKVIAGLEALSRNGLRYPIPAYGVMMMSELEWVLATAEQTKGPL